MSPSEQLYRLIALCYEATSDDSGWAQFAAELARALSATGCAAVIGATASDRETVLWSHGDSPNHSGRWRPGDDGQHAVSPRHTHLRAATTSKGRFLVATVCARNGASRLLIATRPLSAPPFEDMQFDLLAELVPHLARAFRLYRTIRSGEEMHDALTEIMDRLPEAIFLVDRDGLVLTCNGSARAIVRQNDGLSLTDDRICLARPDEQAALRALIAKAGKDPHAKRRQPPGLAADVWTMSATRPSGLRALPMVVTPVLCRSGTADRPAAVAAVITKDVDGGAAVLAPDFAADFNLTRGEARLAGLIADGLGIRDAAEALGITRNTARTHLKRIYAKCGVHSQTDLVRLLNRGSIELWLNDPDG